MKVLFKAKTLLLNQELVSLDMLAAIQDFSDFLLLFSINNNGA